MQKIRMFPQDLLNTLEMWRIVRTTIYSLVQSWKTRPGRLGEDLETKLGEGGASECLKFAYLFLWLELWVGEKRMSVEEG